MCRRLHALVLIGLGTVGVLGIVTLVTPNVRKSPWEYGFVPAASATNRDRQFEPRPQTRRIPILIAAGCFAAGEVTLDRVEVDEDDESVIVMAYIRRPRRDSPEDCLNTIGHTVELEERLRGRVVLDGASDPPSRPGTF